MTRVQRAAVPKPHRVRHPVDAAQEWAVDTDETREAFAFYYPEQHGWEWVVIIPLNEFIRDEPLWTQLHLAIEHALLQVRGVDEAVHEDREKWIVSGRRVKGKALLAATVDVLVRFGPEIREAMTFDGHLPSGRPATELDSR